MTKSRKSRNTADNSSSYVGRFAPSPTGPLHPGSLLCALASYLDARANHGRWLLRIEDIDPPREMPGAADDILTTLQAHGLHWDGDVVWQSEQTQRYQQTLDHLLQAGLAYRCDCSRSDVAAMGGIYNGRCRDRALTAATDSAVRLKLASMSPVHIEDSVQARQVIDLEVDVGDFVIRRRDGLFAYQLAVVVDDAWQGITHVLRGTDLFDSTPRQIALQSCLGLSRPKYAHIPILLNSAGHKLSKQTHAPALDNQRAEDNLRQALRLLGQQLPERGGVDALLRWAVQHWALTEVPRTAGISVVNSD